MSLPTSKYDLSGNLPVVDGVKIAFDSMVGSNIVEANRPYIVAGTGAPTFTAPQGSMYIRIDGGAGARLYMNSTGSTAWIVAGSAN
jgi:hypothetical protein